MLRDDASLARGRAADALAADARRDRGRGRATCSRVGRALVARRARARGVARHAHARSTSPSVDRVRSAGSCFAHGCRADVASRCRAEPASRLSRPSREPTGRFDPPRHVVVEAVDARPRRGPRPARRPHVAALHPDDAVGRRRRSSPAPTGVLAGTACATETFAQLDPTRRGHVGRGRRRRARRRATSSARSRARCARSSPASAPR